VLVCGGSQKNQSMTDICEVINLKSSNSTCKNLPKFPVPVAGAIGGLVFKETPIVCGGIQIDNFSNKCYSLKNKEWVSSYSMNSARAFAAAAQLQDGKLLVSGGSIGSDQLNSTEVLSEEGWEKNAPFLPVSIEGHCMVQINSTTVMIIGGSQNNSIKYKANTFYLNLKEHTWTEGPKLTNARAFHTCGRIRKDPKSQEISIIVVGGTVGGSDNTASPNITTTSVEILDKGSNEWRKGPALPFGIGASQMVEVDNGGVALIGGGSDSELYLDTIFQLPHGGKNAGWTEMKQKLTTGRYGHTAFLVPDPQKHPWS
jgi:N-acetylneuraminic acid mutarotase